MATPDPLATPADLAAYMGQTFDATAEARATELLRAASAQIRGWTRQTITLVTDDMVTLRIVDPCGPLVLPQRPVVSVSSVKAHGRDLLDWVLSGEQLLRYGGWTYLPGTTTYPDPGLVEVTYTHGYAEVPEDVRAVCLELAAASYTNADGLRQETIDDYSRTFATETVGAGTLTPAQQALLARYRRRVGTVGLR